MGRAALGAALLALAACAPAPSVTVARGALTVAGPAGFCVQPRPSRRGGAAPVVVLDACGKASPAPALLTATVSGQPAEIPDPRALEAYLRSAPGRAAMARNGQAGAVSVRAAQVEEDVLYLNIRDTAEPGDYWRAVLEVRGHLVILAVRGPAGRVLPREEGRRLAAAFVAAMRAANPAPPPRPAA